MPIRRPYFKPREQFYAKRNFEIKAPRVRLIGVDSKQIGVVALSEAVEYAQKHGVDLIEISSSVNPPVCKAIAFDKFKYEQQQKLKKAKKKQKEVDLKQFRLRINISPHDLEVRLNRIHEFLQKGDKIKIILMFRGRENSRKELGYELIQKIFDHFGEQIKIEKPPLKQGSLIITTFSPNKGAKSKEKTQ